MNIVIPMAGKSSRFFDAGFTVPKFLLPLSTKQNGISMIQGAVDSLHMEGQLIFIVQRDHCMFGIDSFLKEKYPDCIVLYLERYTGGCVESVYEAAKAYINNDTPLVISNCDQYLEWNSDEFLRICGQPNVDGCVLTYFADTTKNSYCTVDNNDKCILFKEKEVISPHSLVGVHYWKKGSDFVASAEHMIENNVRDAGEYYVSTSYNYLVNQGKHITLCPMRNNETYHTIGTPETYYQFLQSQDPIQITQLKDMTRGWFLGGFLPCAYSSKDVEVGILEHKAGEKSLAHVHIKGDEINVLLYGSMQINSQKISAREVFVIPKGHLTKAVFFEDCCIVCVKLPSDTKDKYCY